MSSFFYSNVYFTSNLRKILFYLCGNKGMMLIVMFVVLVLNVSHTTLKNRNIIAFVVEVFQTENNYFIKYPRIVDD